MVGAMPELPEVEVIAQELRALLEGRTVIRARLLRPGLAPAIRPQTFARTLSGASVTSVERRGKHLLFRLSKGRTLITHLRMTGSFIDGGPAEPPPIHTHAVFWLDNERRLFFADQRHFAWMHIAKSSELESVEQLRRLGPEPLGPGFDLVYFYNAIRRSSRAIKLVLLDQTRVVGLGNIYAAEALFRARINPMCRAAGLSRRRAAVLHREIVNVLSEAIAAGSVPYQGNDASWSVYDREGEPCPVCAKPIRRIAQGGRSTYYCPACQCR